MEYAGGMKTACAILVVAAKRAQKIDRPDICEGLRRIAVEEIGNKCWTNVSVVCRIGGFRTKKDLTRIQRDRLVDRVVRRMRTQNR